jgi:hypothetical protein
MICQARNPTSASEPIRLFWLTFRIGVQLAVLTLSLSSARAEERMTFDVIKDPGSQSIIARGEITGDTPALFVAVVRDNHLEEYASSTTVYFDSPGGNLAGGLKLGSEIRRLRMATKIGKLGKMERTQDCINFVHCRPTVSRGPDLPAICASACTFAFLGGIERSVTEGSRFGVHRFSGTSGDTEQSAQIAAGVIVDYLKEMGVSSGLFTVMTEASPDEILLLDEATMTRLGIITKEMISSTLTASKLVVTNGVGNRHTDIEFLCGDRRRFVARIFYGKPVGELTTLQWIFRNPSLSEQRLIVSGFRLVGDMIEIDLPPQTVASLANAQSFELEAYVSYKGLHELDSNRPVIGLPWELPQDIKLMLRGLADSCR